MGLTAFDIIVLIAVGGAALLGLKRGFVAEVLSVGAWVAAVIALKLFHSPLTQALTGTIGTVSGAAVLAFALLTGGTIFLGRLVANAIGRRTRTSVLGPVDRGLGFGFGAVKGVIGASLAFLLVALVMDTVGGGRTRRPAWMTTSRTYTLLDSTSASIADVLDRRRKGEPMWPASRNRREPAS